ncbi:uncharacterized protein EURHEDRAFT_390647 [Aspergillus ruber CBS 135680]|uniref:NmrA-like domain-containing protein n=1 Tax=Aspergillus ruber (strain CBS 135680) TaxID=1388766 RepID=A0A017S1N5_ASPRC|nr:uncharacterized protein EURHEDRAFT_390647 [Aspergillus ruber CBS 135680]EYE90040.1 hypothetical protein EURHEDRAFT_390647 [Aspergillus ruber CBS 135680]
MPTIEAAIVGVSGESSQSIVNALLESSTPKYVSYLAPNQLGVKVVLADLHGLSNKLVELLSGIDVVISAIYFDSPDDEILLANAAKAAGVTRFIQSALMSVIHRRVSEEEAIANIDSTRARLDQNPTETSARLAFIAAQLCYS